MALQITKELSDILSKDDTIAVISAIGKDGAPYTEVAKKIRVWDENRIAYYEFLESSQMQKNLVYSIWFNKEISISLLTGDGRNYVLRGKLYQDVMAGREFEQEYENVQKEFGEETDLSSVWLIDIVSWKEETYSVALRRQKEEHPYLIHMDQIYK